MKRIWLPALLALALVATSVYAQRRRRAPRPNPSEPITVGMVAPDFELVLFEDVDVDDPTSLARAERVKLSSFRRTLPVALIFGSYT